MSYPLKLEALTTTLTLKENYGPPYQHYKQYTIPP